MINTIPAVSRAAGRGRWISSSVVYVVASVTGGLTVGLALGILGYSPATWIGQEFSLAITAIAVCLFGFVDLGVIALPRIQRDAQVPETWRRRFHPEMSSAFYGAILGAGILTKISFASFYAITTWSIFSGDIFASAIILGTFAFFRALPQLVLFPFLRDTDHSLSLTLVLVRFHQTIGRIGGVLMVLLGALLGADVLARL